MEGRRGEKDGENGEESMRKKFERENFTVYRTKGSLN